LWHKRCRNYWELKHAPWLLLGTLNTEFIQEFELLPTGNGCYNEKRREQSLRDSRFNYQHIVLG